jgi:hypothetical protein
MAVKRGLLRAENLNDEYLKSESSAKYDVLDMNEILKMAGSGYCITRNSVIPVYKSPTLLLLG